MHRVKNPILLARAVMEKSPHVMLTGDGAEAFAKTVGIELVDPSYFRTEERWQQLQDELKTEAEKQASTLDRAVHHGCSSRRGPHLPRVRPSRSSCT